MESFEEEEERKRNGKSTTERDVKSLPDGAVGNGRGCGVQAAATASREKHQWCDYEGTHYYIVDVSKQLQSGSPPGSPGWKCLGLFAFKFDSDSAISFRWLFYFD